MGVAPVLPGWLWDCRCDSPVHDGRSSADLILGPQRCIRGSSVLCLRKGSFLKKWSSRARPASVNSRPCEFLFSKFRDPFAQNHRNLRWSLSRPDVNPPSSRGTALSISTLTNGMSSRVQNLPAHFEHFPEPVVRVNKTTRRNIPANLRPCQNNHFLAQKQFFSCSRM